ncbi:MAG: MATE family efflux transporter [Sphaerochaetaceae bacterium]|nr:MATE family efflux transporter [Sphaerochaetaceae bacterium]
MDTDRKNNLKVLITLAIPVILEQILTTLLQYVDTAMVGQLGAQATAAVSQTTTVNWLIGSVFGAVGVAVTAMVASAYGAKDYQKIKRITAQVVFYALFCGLFTTLAATTLSPFIPVWMQAAPEIQKNASEYFFIISCALLFRSANMIFASALRAVKDTKTPMVINMAANVLNVILNYLLIYTAGLGVRGAAIATAVSSAVSGTLMFLAMQKNSMLKAEIRKFSIDRVLLMESSQIALPTLATSTASCMGHIVFASLVSSMGTIVFAAHSIALSAETIFYLPGYGLRSATSTLIGISVGENNKEKFAIVKHQSIVVTLLMMALSGVILFLFARPIMSIFTPDQEVIRLGTRVLKLIALSEPLFGLMIVSEGIYYGLGKTTIPFFVETAGAWCIRIVFTTICVKVLHTTLFEVWICMFADNAFRALAMAIPLLAGKDKKYFDQRRRAM